MRTNGYLNFVYEMILVSFSFNSVQFIWHLYVRTIVNQCRWAGRIEREVSTHWLN